MSDIVNINVSEITEEVAISVNFQHPNIQVNSNQNINNVNVTATPNVVQININKVYSNGANWGNIIGNLENQTDLQNALDLKANSSDLIENHSELNFDDGTNPHGTTKLDVGLGNVDNTSDLNKPISTATQNALDSKIQQNGNSFDEEMVIGTNDGNKLSLETNNLKALTIDTVQKVIIGNNTAIPVSEISNTADPKLQVHGLGQDACASVDRFSNDNASAKFHLQKSRGANFNQHVAVQNGDVVGNFNFTASDGTRFLPVASIISRVDGVPSTDAMFGNLGFMVTSGGTALLQRLTLFNNGELRSNVTNYETLVTNINSIPNKRYVDLLADEFVNVNTVARNRGKYIVTTTGVTFTDPTPLNGQGFTVYVRQGTAIVGGVTYPIGSYVMRYYHQGSLSWRTEVLRSDRQQYRVINTNTTIDDSYHNAIVFVTANATITIPSGLRTDFTCKFRTYAVATATYVAGSGATISAESDLTVQPSKRTTQILTPSLNNFIIITL